MASDRSYSAKLDEGQLLEALFSKDFDRAKVLRKIILAVDLSETSAHAVQWAAEQVYRSGDAFHLAHIVTCLRPPGEVFHGVPGTSLSFQAPEGHHERQEVLAAQHHIRDHLVPLLDKAKAAFEVHVFVDTANAPASALGDTFLKLAQDEDAALIVTHSSIQSAGALNQLSPVATYLAEHTGKLPLIIFKGR